MLGVPGRQQQSGAKHALRLHPGPLLKRIRLFSLRSQEERRPIGWYAPETPRQRTLMILARNHHRPLDRSRALARCMPPPITLNVNLNLEPLCRHHAGPRLPRLTIPSCLRPLGSLQTDPPSEVGPTHQPLSFPAVVIPPQNAACLFLFKGGTQSHRHHGAPRPPPPTCP
jgi:hypothetical protein